MIRGKKPHSNHNVYILGAGFSVESGVPLINNFLTRMADSVDWLQESGRDEEVEAILKVFEFRHNAAGAAFRAQLDVDNIEELFSLASATRETNLTQYITTAIAATIEFTRTVIQEEPFYDHRAECEITYGGMKHDHRGNVTLTDSKRKQLINLLYAQIISGSFRQENEHDVENTVISFNYDTILEDSITGMKSLDGTDIRFTYGFPKTMASFDTSAICSDNLTEPDLLPIYKLHGSVNWGIDPKKQRVEIYGGYEDLRAYKENILLIPPTWRKVFGSHLSHIWLKAVDAIRDATRIIVIGFSVPPTDTHFKYLIAAGLQNNISLRKFIFVNPGLSDDRQKQKLRENIFSVLRPDLEEKGVVELVAKKTSEYFLDSNLREVIRRRVAPACTQIEYQGAEYQKLIF